MPRLERLAPGAHTGWEYGGSLAMVPDELDSLLAEQVAYYRARAREYDATHAFDAASRARLLDALRAFAPRGRVLELACGTGQWTAELARYASVLTAVDASPEMIALNRARVPHDNVRYVEADLFAWSAPERYDVVFFSVWLSHVPPQRFEGFWTLVADCLNETGRVFVIDELPAVAAHERWNSGAIAPVVERALSTGARYRAVKVLHDPAELRARLSALGWRADIRAVSRRLFYATVARTPST
jgi:demethylmenaquinone methyltransferase/2-methoxy-6-polyprenyl-1,4-benzoquinol methylase